MEDKDDSGTFTREAFLHPANLVFLLVGTITALAFNGAGSHLTSTILTLVIGLELLYLGVIPKLPSYQNNIRLKQQKELSAGSNDNTLFHSINGKSQKKFLVLKHITSEVKKSFENQSYATKGMLDHVVRDRKSTRLNSSHVAISYAVFCLKKKKNKKYNGQSGLHLQLQNNSSHMLDLSLISYLPSHTS